VPKIAIMYLTVLVGAITVFIFSSFWVYHYVELDFEATADEAENQGPTGDVSSLNFGNMLMPFTEGDSSIVTVHPQYHERPGKSSMVKPE
jgi:hypothetical protein